MLFYGNQLEFLWNYSDLKSFWYFTKWILHNTSASKQRMYELRTTCGRHVLLVSSRASVKVNYLDSLKLYDQQNSYSLHKVDFIPKLYRQNYTIKKSHTNNINIPVIRS